MFGYEEEPEKARRRKEEYDRRQEVRELKREARPRFKLTTTNLVITDLKKRVEDLSIRG